MKQNKHFIFVDNSLRISNDQIKRLCRQMGVYSLSSISYDEIRYFMKKSIENLIEKILLFLDYVRRKTVNPNDVVNVYRLFGKKFYGVLPHNNYIASKKITIMPVKKLEGRKRGKGKLAIREINFYQNQDGVFFAYKPFGDFVREIAQYKKDDVRFGGGSLHVIQEIIECEMKALVNNANLCCLHRVSKVVKPKDIQMAAKMMIENSNGKSIFMVIKD